MADILLDFIRVNKPPKQGTHFDSVRIAEGQPVPVVGDTVILSKGQKAVGARIERRNIYYTDGGAYVQLFFRRVYD